MAAYTGIPITDPDQLTFTTSTAAMSTAFSGASTEIVISTADKTIALKVNGNLGTDGATIKAVYSKLKDAWRADSTLVKFPFPMGPITDEQFEMLNGWNWDKTETSGGATQNTVELLRTGGWSVVDVGQTFPKELWTSVVTLGAMGSTDQVYYQQVNVDQASVNFVLTGPVNQAVQILSDPNSDGNTADGYSYTTYFKIFVREWQKLYAQSEIADIGVSTLTYQAYRYPLTNGTDLKVTHLETTVGGVATASGSWTTGLATVITADPHGFATDDVVVIAGVTPSGYNGTYTITVTNSTTFTYTVADPGGVITVQGTAQKEVYVNTSITYLRDANDALYNIIGDASVGSYVVGDVVKDQQTPGRWFECTTAGTVDATDILNLGTLAGAGTAVFIAYEGERQIGANYYAFSVIIDADTNVAASGSGAARSAEIYEAIQYALRQNVDIDADGVGTVTGKTANSLLRFVGDTLVTSTGVYIDSFNSQDTNSITFTDGLGATYTFPFVAALTVNFGANLQNDQYSKYWVFFTNANGNLFGATTAIIVEDADTNPMTDDVNPAWPTKRSQVSHTFNYDSNVQGGRTISTDAAITVVGIGLTTGQYVLATGNIAKSTANAVTLTSSLERNYSQGTTYP